MTIASSNVSFSTIAGEKGIATSNLSLKSLSGKEVKSDTVTGQGYSSSYALTKEKWLYSADSSRNTSMIVTSAQGTGKAGLNTAPYSMSEWVGYNPGFPNIGTSSIPVAYLNKQANFGCVGLSQGDIDVYCRKTAVGTIKFYVNKVSTNALVKYYSDNTSWATLSSETEIGEMTTNSTGMIPTGCTMGTGTGGSSGSSGTAFYSGASVTSLNGNTTNLGSTNIGYRVHAGGWAEGSNFQSYTMYNYASCRFNWTWPTSPSGDTYETSYTDIIVGVYLSGSHTNIFGC